MEHLSYLNKYFLKYRWHLLFGIVFVFISNYFRVLQPQIIREALDLVLDNLHLYRMYEGLELQRQLGKEFGKTLFLFGGIVLVLALLMGVFMYFMRQTIIVMSRLMEYDIRKEIFQHYEKLDMAFYKRHNTGDLMARVTEDVSKVRMYLGPAVLYGINLVSLFIMTIYAMFSVNWQLSLYSLAPLPLLSIAIYYVSNLIHKKSEIIQKQLSKLNSIAQEVFSGIRVVKSYVQERPMAENFSQECADYRKKSLHLATVNSLFYPAMLLMIGASTIITVYIGGLQAAKGLVTPGNIAEFVIYINMLTWPFTAIGWIASIIQQASASQKRINEFLQTQPTITSPTVMPQSLQGHIVFKEVSFTYPDTGIEALKEVSFNLRPGQKMAIIGKTGCGKTTIADLLVRMYDVSAGSIHIDGKDIRSLDLFNLRKKIGYVPQDVFLFSDTVSANIAFGKPNANQAEIEEFAGYASVYDDIKGLEMGFDTVVGERGITLSGGQKQRVAIARALIKKPDILILDDCLSAVDTNTEKQILEYFSTQQLANKTTIVITHRIYSLLRFDQIIVLQDGRIVETGTHESLLELKGYYAELYDNQTQEETVFF